MRLVPWWAVLSSGCAPVLLVGGWVIATLLHGPGYEPATQTISVLAADGASGYWVMTGVLIGLGVCHLVTAWALRPAALAGRVALGAGGVSAMVLVLSPAPRSGGSLGHGAVVVVGFILLALWPILAAVRSAGAPWGLQPGVSVVVTGLMWVGAAWFLAELLGHGSPGVAERALTTAQSLWPFIVVVSCLRHSRSS